MKLKSILALPIITLPIITFIACNNSPENISQKTNTFVVGSSEPLDLKGYDLDYSVADTITLPSNDYLATLGAGKMIRFATTGSAEYNETGTKVIKSAYTKYKMDLISEIHLTNENGDKTVFDSDEADIPSEQTQQPYVILTSSNAKSINHLSFAEKLKSAVKMTFKVKPDIYWINTKGEKTKYKLSATDFFYSYLRSYYSGSGARTSTEGGGSTEADAIINKKFSNIGNYFRKEKLFTKNYLFTTYGISIPSFEDESKSINLDNTEFTFEKLSGVQAQFQTFLDQFLATSNIFAAAPSEYIKEQYELKYKNEFENYKKKINEMTEEQIYQQFKEEIDKKIVSESKTKSEIVNLKRNDLINQHQYGQGPVLKLGIYWYGLSGWKDNLYIGPYYPSEVKANSFIFKYNPEFADQNWVNVTDKVETFVIEYQYKNKNDFSKFKQGSLSEIRFNKLSSDEKSELLKNRDNYGYKYLKNLNSMYSVNKASILTNPKPLPSALGVQGQDQDYDYSFNDAYAKIMYGRDKATLKKANNYGVSKNLYQSYGLSFRSLITTALNWEHIAKEATGDDNAISWTAQLSPDVSIGGLDQRTSKIKTPRDSHEEINTLFAVNSKGEKIVGSEVKPSENSAAIKKTDIISSYKSANFQILKTAMATLIQEMKEDSELNFSEDFTLQWEIANTEVLDDKGKEIYANMVQTLTELNPKIKPVFKELKTVEEITSYYAGFQNYYRRAGIENDFDGVGSWLDKQGHDIGISPWALFKIYSEKDENDPKNPFPEFTKMAKELKRQAGTGEFKLPEAGKFENWDNFLSELESGIYQNKALFDNDTVVQITGFGGIGYKKDPLTGKVVINNQIEYARFGKKYQDSKTNKELVQLIKEYNILKGIALNTDPKIFGNKKVDVVFYQKGIKTPLAKDAIVYASDIQITK